MERGGAVGCSLALPRRLRLPARDLVPAAEDPEHEQRTHEQGGQRLPARDLAPGADDPEHEQRTHEQTGSAYLPAISCQARTTPNASSDPTNKTTPSWNPRERTRSSPSSGRRPATNGQTTSASASA